ncbi:MAG: hypothetical protein JO130_02755 [Solirubrobacterales bacterium]|nr:hypothetical protein [Solirubrobacterales bacterium]
MSVTVADIEFAQHHYDDRGDVLYLSVDGYDGHAPSPHADATPEGHGIEWDDKWRVIAMTLVNFKWLIERDGELRITWPDGHVTRDEPFRVLAAAA